MTPEQATQFMELLVKTVRVEQDKLLQTAVEPIVKHMDVMARQQAAMAQLLQQNRRDHYASVVLKSILDRTDPEVLAETSAEAIAQQAYNIAVAMENEGEQVANLRARQQVRRLVEEGGGQVEFGDEDVGVAVGRIFRDGESGGRTGGDPSSN